MLRTEDQHVVAADRLDRRAFPHVSEIFKAGDLQLPRKLPALRGRIGTIDDHAAFLLRSLRTDHEVVFSVFEIVNDLRIALMLGIPRIRSEQQRLLPGSAVLQFDETGVRLSRPVLISVIARIVQI